MYPLYHHLEQLEVLMGDCNKSKDAILLFFKGLVDRMFVNREIERELDENFLKVIRDIDDLVQEEYLNCTGKKPVTGVFDKDKTGDLIGDSLEKEAEIAEHFMKEYRKRPSRELADAFRKVHEIPTFEKVSAVGSRDVFETHKR